MFQFEKIYTSWTGERILRHVLYWLVWLLFYASVNSAYWEHTFWQWMFLEMVIMFVKLPFVYFVIYYLVPQFLINKRYIPFALITFVLAGLGGILINVEYNIVINPHILGIDCKRVVLKKFNYLVLDLIYIASLPIILKLLQRQLNQEKITLQVAEQKLSAELKLLKNQLHPHFLFNTLNNLYGMVLTQHPNAAQVVVRLSDMMSYMLYETERESIPLEKEIANLKNYIELEKIRHGNRVDISFETGGMIAGRTIAPLLLIPFVENAFKHGVEKSDKKSWIRINLWVEFDRMIFMVENSLPNEEPSENDTSMHSGIGLKNVRKRLEMLYADKYILEIKKEETYFVQLNLKL